jgi:hypothetical protein
MKHSKWFSGALLCIGMGIFAFTACQKNASSGSSSVPAGQQKFQMYLTDGPVNFQEVNIDIKSIIVFLKTDSCTASGYVGSDSTFPCYHWDTLNIQPGVYNILDFQNGVDTLFSSTNIDKGTILKIRIVLGDSNSVMADSVLFPLNLLWGNTFDIVVNTGCQQLNDNTIGLWLDFDAEHSIVEVRHQEFALNPVIRLFTPNSTGSVEGAVLPNAADAFITVASGGDTLIALPGRDGRWEIRGVKESSVNVTFWGTANGYGDTTISNVNITPGTTTNLGTVYLH